MCRTRTSCTWPTSRLVSARLLGWKVTVFWYPRCSPPRFWVTNAGRAISLFMALHVPGAQRSAGRTAAGRPEVHHPRGDSAFGVIRSPRAWRPGVPRIWASSWWG